MDALPCRFPDSFVCPFSFLQYKGCPVVGVGSGTLISWGGNVRIKFSISKMVETSLTYFDIFNVKGL